MKKIRITRDGAIFISGLAILFHEAVIRDVPTERPQLLIIAAMMIGLPAFLRRDESSPPPPPSTPPSEANGAKG